MGKLITELSKQKVSVLMWMTKMDLSIVIKAEQTMAIKRSDKLARNSWKYSSCDLNEYL